MDLGIYDKVKTLFELNPPEMELGDKPEQSPRLERPAKRQRCETHRKDSVISTPKATPEQESQQGKYCLPKNFDNESANSEVMYNLGQRPARAAHVHHSTPPRVMPYMGSPNDRKEPRQEDQDRVSSSPPYRDYSRVPSPNFSIDDNPPSPALTAEAYDLSNFSLTPVSPASPSGSAAVDESTLPQSTAISYVGRATRTATGKLPLRGTQIQLEAERMKVTTLESQIKRFQQVGKQNKALRATNESLKSHIATSAQRAGKSVLAARQEAEEVVRVSILELDNLGLDSAVRVRDTRILELEATINDLRGQLGLEPAESSFGPEEEDDMF